MMTMQARAGNWQCNGPGTQQETRCVTIYVGKSSSG